MNSPARVPLILLALAATLAGCASTSEPEADKNNPYGIYLSARLAASEHDIPDAATLYRESLSLDPNNPELLDRAFLYAAISGNLDEAVKLAHRISQANTENRAAQLALVVDRLRNDDYAGAHAEIAKAGKGPFAALTLSLLDAWAAQGMGQTDQAIAELKGVTKEGGTDTLVAYQSALVYDQAGRNEAAQAAYLQALQAGLSPRAVDAYGRFLERNGHAAEARAFYTKMLGEASVKPIAVKGLARLDQNEIPDRLVETAADGAAEALFAIAASLTDQANADTAVICYLQFALALSPKFDLARIELGDRYEALNKFDDAIAVYKSVDASSPYKADADVQIAVDENRAGHKDQAIADLVSITKDHPNDISAWTSLGDVYRSAEKYPAAADAYDHAVKLLSPITKDDWPLFFARAVAEEQSGRWDLAEADLETALKLSPDQAQVLNFLGYSWVDRGQHLAEALNMLEKARALSPYDGYIVDSVGWAYYRLGRFNDAAKTLENAVLLVPGDSTINDHLGDAYWRVGRKLDAHFQWSHALAFGPEAAEKSKLQKKLTSGLEPGGDPT
ncbi:MAG TPA: tetratricopeptide repeat protein [Rhizomicrobium sp.]|nr:tetratricopeptide repeat protein [Rhizomicrobium sp.]